MKDLFHLLKNKGETIEMEKYNLKNKEIKLHNILFATTSTIDYYMERLILLQDMPESKENEYVLVEGYHCSCYGFDETEWDCTKLTETELKKILNSNNGELRKRLKAFLENYGTEI